MFFDATLIALPSKVTKESHVSCIPPLFRRGFDRSAADMAFFVSDTDWMQVDRSQGRRNCIERLRGNLPKPTPKEWPARACSDGEKGHSRVRNAASITSLILVMTLKKRPKTSTSQGQMLGVP